VGKELNNLLQGPGRNLQEVSSTSKGVSNLAQGKGFVPTHHDGGIYAIGKEA